MPAVCMNSISTIPRRDDAEPPQFGAVRTAFAQFESHALAGGEPDWLISLRRRELTRFLEAGYPTRRDEDWRHTSLEAVSALPFTIADSADPDDRFGQLLAGSTFSSVSGRRLVFLNGHLITALPRAEQSNDGVYLAGLARAVREKSEILRARLMADSENGSDGSLGALNLAFAREGAVVIVPANTVVDEPIILVFVSSPRIAGERTHVRNVIVAGPNSRATVIEHYIGLGTEPSVTSSVTELHAGQGAVLEHLKLQDEARSVFHLATLQARLESSSDVNCHSFALGSRLARQNVLATLAGEGIEAVFNGLYLGDADRLIDHYLSVDHVAPGCTSHEFFNGVLDDKATGVFYGRIQVRQHAQKTDAKQTNKNLLLSDDAAAHTRPQLEIYADDVKCTHGATIGQLDPEGLFYLRSRGLPIATARRMLIHAFAGEIIERVSCRAARDVLDRLVWERVERTRHVAESNQ
jgi:Fe-S cluster assembly protein SufD